jgi:general secretion pathway protein G
MKGKIKMKKGFTLVEIITVLVLIGILVSIVLPIYRNATIRAKEAVLKENLFQIRDALNKYYKDKHKYPTDLEDLVIHKYLRKVPVDPIMQSNEWDMIRFEPEEMEDFDPEIAEGIIDVRSLSHAESLDGSKYSDW